MARGLTKITTRPRIGPGSAGLLMTAEEFDAIEEGGYVEGYRYELIRGVLVVSPMAGSRERGPNDILGHLLRTYWDAHPDGPLDDTMPEQYLLVTPDRRRCDRAIWTGLGREPEHDLETPSIVVEFVSARKRDAVRDYETKRDEYGRIGVREYWVVDRFRRQMTVYHYPSGQAPPRAEVVGEAGEYRTDLLPGFTLPIRRLLPTAVDAPAKRARRRRDRD